MPKPEIIPADMYWDEQAQVLRSIPFTEKDAAELCKKQFIEIVGSHYAEQELPTLMRLKYHPKLTINEKTWQETLVNPIQANPDGSFLILGRWGCGKSWVKASLFRHVYTREFRKLFQEFDWTWIRRDDGIRRLALRINNWQKWPLVWQRLSEHFDERHAYATQRPTVDEDGEVIGEVSEPKLWRRKFGLWKRDGLKARTFITELDKIGNESKARKAWLFDLLDDHAMFNFQFVADSNLTKSELMEYVGEASFRRFTDYMTIIDLHGEK